MKMVIYYILKILLVIHLIKDDMKKIIRKILKEDRRQMYLDKIINFMRNDFPLFKNMKNYVFYDQLSEDELNYVFSGIFGKPVKIKFQSIYDDRGNEIYYEEPNGRWEKYGYDENGNEIYSENSYGDWKKWEYDENGNIIYYENSEGFWEKIEYDKNSNIIYYEKFNGYWYKTEYDENGKLIYFETSNGYTIDNR